MFGSRAVQNRRYKRHHVLDVKVSTQQRRRVWLQRLGIALVGLFVVGFAVLVVWRGGGPLLDRLVYQNPAFEIHHLEVETDGVFSLDQLRAWAGVRLRDNLLAADLGRIRRDLELVPAIESAVVERVLPHTLRIRVTERVPIAQVTLPSLRPGSSNGCGVYLVDAKGVFMFPVEPQQRATPAATNNALPALIGIPGTDVRPGRPSELPQVMAALQLLRAFECSPLAARFSLREIDLSVPNLLQVKTSQGSEAVLAPHDLDRQLRRWGAVHEHGQKVGKVLAWIDLSVGNNLPSRWQEAGVEPLVPVRTNPPAGQNRKNV